MPRRTASEVFHDVKDQFPFLRRRRKPQRPRPQRYADIAATQRQSQPTTSSEHRTESLVSFWQIIREGRVAPSPPAVVGSSSDHVFVDPPLIDSTIRRDSLGERVVIPIVSCATSQPDAPAGEAGEQVWYLPGAALGAEAYPQNFAQGRYLNGALFVVGLVGHEDGMNLLLLLTTLSFAYEHDMMKEIEKIKDTTNRYIILRMFYHNPHHTTFSLDGEAAQVYFKFRSEELYRAWVTVGKNERLQSFLSQDKLVDMYICMVKGKWWFALTVEYQKDFNAQILRKYKEAKHDLMRKCEETFNTFSDRTAFGMHPWMQGAPDSSDSEAASQQPSPGTVAGPSRLPVDDYPFLQPPVNFSNSSVSTGRRRRHVRRETSVMQPSHQPIDLIDPTE
ncbi:hypothetical protein NW768_008770 [Fusarium equiseti]|uniref:Uncharacterized protein n=1 Tax=Fusarium equiseti TaxID=61235 RepID=A0ABQ8R589_FUSEQ|nr:hypothetical protein NW768_008770 [Fusarium equiseti]